MKLNTAPRDVVWLVMNEGLCGFHVLILSNTETVYLGKPLPHLIRHEKPQFMECLKHLSDELHGCFERFGVLLQHNSLDLAITLRQGF